MVETALTLVALFTIFDGITLVVEELEEHRRLKHRIELLREARRNQ